MVEVKSHCACMWFAPGLTHIFPQFQKWNIHFDGKLQNNLSKNGLNLV